MPITGGCLCGQVRYSVDAEPVFQVACHCTNCQRQSGSAFSINVGVRKSALAITGVLKTYVGHGDSGRPVQWLFCPDCGSLMLTEIELDPGLAILKGGTFDDRSIVRPQRHIYCASRQDWFTLPERVPAHDGATPPRDLAKSSRSE
jgi:hypothetical protein